jgi:hypothetical protein
MTMNSTPLDSSFQYASWEQKKILPRFFRLREIHKKTKNPKKLIFLAPTPTNEVYDRNFPYA